tara:strand:- start:74852 stop:76552 length:1701 start_codon:yes stop_codon:yes gene_type:complete
MKILLIIALTLLSVHAKTSRVIDVQESIKTDVEEYIKVFSPDAKYSVSVKVIPLTRKSIQGDESDLPFLDYESENILDEWDDPIRSTYSLYERIKEVEITLVFNEDIKIKDTSRFKDSLLKSVNLIPGRDRILIETMNGPLIQKEFKLADYIDYMILLSVLIATMIIGIGLNTLSRKIGPPLKTSNDNSDVKSTGAIAPMASSSSLNLGKKSTQEERAISGGLNIEDPKRIHDMVKSRIEKLVKSGTFPSHNDLIILEEELLINPKSFSYLVYEFPLDYQKRIFELGRKSDWLQGFLEIGFPTRSVIVVLDKMLRSRNENSQNQLNELLAYMWRLDDLLPKFIKEMDKETAMKILKLFPKNISIPVARECFPGTWGEVLSENFEDIKINGKDLVKLMQKCKDLKPLYQYEALQKFKSKTDLLNYLDEIEPHEEKEIYAIISGNDELYSLRAPFYKFFELAQDDRREVFEAFSITNWAYACFNIERKDREQLKEILDEKEKYLFGNTLAQLDNMDWDIELKVESRKEIARYIAKKFGVLEKSQVKDAFDEFMETLDESEGKIEDQAA